MYKSYKLTLIGVEDRQYDCSRCFGAGIKPMFVMLDCDSMGNPLDTDENRSTLLLAEIRANAQ